MQSPGGANTYLQAMREYSRLAGANRTAALALQHPNSVFIQLHPAARAPKFSRTKFIIDRNANFAAFMRIVREYCKLPASAALFYYVGNTIPPGATPLGELYDARQGADGVLHITVCAESTYG